MGKLTSISSPSQGIISQDIWDLWDQRDVWDRESSLQY